ncbi:MAG: lysozyme inhibitor LprI family protein [Rhodanobacter sp.]
MKKLRIRTLAFALLSFGASAYAAESTSDVIREQAPKGISAGFYSCIDAAGSDTVATAACLSNEKAAQDKRLNTTYKALLGKLDAKEKAKLMSAERSWLKFQNDAGAFQNNLYGDETLADLQLTQNEIFSICLRANALGSYLAVANDK